MLSYRLAVGLALACAFAFTPVAKAHDDVLRLTGPALLSDAKTETLNLKPALHNSSADTIPTHFRGYWGGYGGYYGGYRGYYGGGYGWGYRPYYSAYSFYRPYYGGYYGYRPYYGGYYGGYGGYGWGGYGRGFGLYFRLSDTEGADTLPICWHRSVVIRSSPQSYYYPSQELQQYQQQYYAPQYQQHQPPQTQLPDALNEPQPTLRMPRADEAATFPYDGGPTSPVPMPKVEEKPTLIPSRPSSPKETLVSHPTKPTEEKKSGKWTYPAYGEKPTRSSK